MATRDYREYRRSSVAGYRYNETLGSRCAFALETQKDLLTEILFRGNYPDFKMHPRYNAVWEEYTSRYRLIKVCPAFKINDQNDENFHLHRSTCDLFALECLEDDSFAVFVGIISHIFTYGAHMDRLRRVEVLYVLDWQISKDEEMLLKLSI